MHWTLKLQQKDYYVTMNSIKNLVLIFTHTKKIISLITIHAKMNHSTMLIFFIWCHGVSWILVYAIFVSSATLRLDIAS